MSMWVVGWPPLPSTRSSPIRIDLRPLPSVCWSSTASCVCTMSGLACELLPCIPPRLGVVSGDCVWDRSTCASLCDQAVSHTFLERNEGERCTRRC